MTDLRPENNNLAFARQTQHKFEFYFIALVFTILALSIQTSVMTSSNWQRFFEILSWICLLLSGLAGLSRLEWVAVAFRQYGVRQSHQKDAKKTDKGLAGTKILKKDGTPMSREELLTMKKKYIARIYLTTKEIRRIEKSLSLKYKIHKWGFVIGLCSLIISRAMQKLTV